jgi:hypothetical protein
VPEREYMWSPEGAKNAAANRVTTVEVIDALYAPDHLRVDRPIGQDLLVVAGMASTGRVIAVMCERVADTARYQVVNAVPVTGAALNRWRGNLP